MNGFQNLWTRLTTPFANDPDNALREYMTRVILLMQGIALTVFTIPIVVGWITGAFPLEAIITMLSLLVPTIAGFWWAYHGRWQIARHIPPILFFALGLYFSFTSPLGMISLLFFILAVMLTSMLQGLKVYWLVLGLSLAAYFAIGAGRSQESIQGIIEVIIIVGGTSTGIALLQWFSINQFHRAILKEHKHREELDDANQNLHTEIAERGRAEQELRESEERYQLLSDATFEAIFLSEKGICFGQNKTAEKMFGYTLDESLGRPGTEWIAPGYRDTVMKKMLSGYEQPYEATALRKDGSTFPCEIQGRMTDYKGKRIRITALRDITNRMQAEESLRESEIRYRALFEQTNDAVFLISLDGIHMEVNPQVSDMLGYPVDEIIGRPLYYFIVPEEKQIGLDRLAQLLGEHTLPVYECTFLRKDGTTVPVEITAALVRDAGGKPLHIHSVVRDITERKRAEEELAKHRDHLEELVEQRTTELNQRVEMVESLNLGMSNLLSDLNAANAIAEENARNLRQVNADLESFTYSVSHDLRAPLRAVDGFSQILLEDYAQQLPAEAVRYLDKVSEGAQHMGELIQDLLDLSRLGRKPLQKMRIDPGMVVEQTLKELAREQEGRAVEIEVGDLPPCQGDPSLMKQVYHNLISNALKFTRQREDAKIEIGWQDSGDETVYFVKDNGVGFDMEYADKLFGVFQRLHPVEQFEGTGVGLAIVQRIIRRHGGRVWAEAEVDLGATFYFSIPEEDSCE